MIEAPRGKPRGSFDPDIIPGLMGFFKGRTFIKKQGLFLDGSFKETGVQIHIKKSIYAPVLNELHKFGISMTETIEEMSS